MDLTTAKQEAYQAAVDSLARYKFMMFGYWAAIWVHLNHIEGNREPNPFKALVDQARQLQEQERLRPDRGLPRVLNPRPARMFEVPDDGQMQQFSAVDCCAVPHCDVTS